MRQLCRCTACWDFLCVIYVGSGLPKSSEEVMDIPEQPKLHPTQNHGAVISDTLPVTVFSRHHLALHAFLLEDQPWFCARDTGRLMGIHLSERVVNKLD
jgi:hypothetical protein